MKIVNGKVTSMKILDASNKKISNKAVLIAKEVSLLQQMLESVKPADKVDERNIARAKQMAKSSKTSLESLKMVIEAL